MGRSVLCSAWSPAAGGVRRRRAKRDLRGDRNPQAELKLEARLALRQSVLPRSTAATPRSSNDHLTVPALYPGCG